MSFELAAKSLSADVSNLTASSSSVTKGESLIDTFLTLESLGADVVIMRHPQSGAPNVAARNIKASVINAGDGWHAHPTQALLDMYTMKTHKGNSEGTESNHYRRCQTQPRFPLQYLGTDYHGSQRSLFAARRPCCR